MDRGLVVSTSNNIARQPYERRHGRSRSRLSAKHAFDGAPAPARAREIWKSLARCRPWTNGSSHFGSLSLEARQTVRICRLWIAVDMRISCVQFRVQTAASGVGDQLLEDAKGEERAASDQPGEVTDCVRARAQECLRFRGRVDPARADDIER